MYIKIVLKVYSCYVIYINVNILFFPSSLYQHVSKGGGCKIPIFVLNINKNLTKFLPTFSQVLI
jgi:hypothetical protein